MKMTQLKEQRELKMINFIKNICSQTKHKKIICPFHKEISPSCIVTDSKFHCFGCGKSGTLIELKKKMEEANEH